MWDTVDLVFAAGGGRAWYWDHSDWVWAMGFHGLFWLAVVVAVVAVLILSYRAATGGGGAPPRDSALDKLKARYARGEIERDEYLEKRGDLT